VQALVPRTATQTLEKNSCAQKTGRRTSVERETVFISTQLNQEIACLINDHAEILRVIRQLKKFHKEIPPFCPTTQLVLDCAKGQKSRSIGWHELQGTSERVDAALAVAERSAKDAVRIGRFRGK
jgi:hypothetical protein